LSLQLNRLEDQQAVKAFQEGQRRIEAIALIHQRLYQSEELTAIDMGQFVEELTLNTMIAYGYQPGSVRLHIRSDVEVLDIDMAVPFSLIVNEILTNAFKYAIPNVPDPTLTIALLKQEGLLLEVADNGPGINLAHWHSPTSSFGKRLIKGLSDQLGGTLTVENRAEERTYVPNQPRPTVAIAERTGTYFRLHVPTKRVG
jgi:two-component sensor histidine kinase